jgi:hypothetical protein
VGEADLEPATYAAAGSLGDDRVADRSPPSYRG